MEYRCRIVRRPEDDPAVVLRGLGSGPRVTRVVEVEADPPLDAAEVAAGYRVYDVYHTGPEGARYIVHGEGFVFGGHAPVPWNPRPPAEDSLA